MSKGSGGTKSSNSSTAHGGGIKAQYEKAKLNRAKAIKKSEDIMSAARDKREAAYDAISAKSDAMKAAGKPMSEIKAYRKKAYEKADKAYAIAQHKATKLENDADAKVQALKMKMNNAK